MTTTRSACLLSLTPLLTTLPLLGALACGDASGGLGIGPPTAGSFGNTSAFPECGAFSQACIQGGFNAPLAAGAKVGVGIDFRTGGSSAPEITLRTSVPDILTAESGVLTAHVPGASALLVEGPDGAVIDFIHLWVAQPTELRLIRYNDAGVALGAVRDEATLLSDDQILIVLDALAGNQALLGLFKATWTVEILEPGPEPDAPVVSVVEDLVFGWYRLVARQPGRVRVTVEALELTHTLELEVLP